MKSRSLNELRKMFLDFFESKGHLVHPSYSLVPQDDPSLLLISAGMAPLKPYFMGKEEPPKTRMATCQKCVRTGDIENVGITARHATFFEMLGNFSFGDYFKRESIKWGWEFVTDVLEMPIEKVWVSVYEEDDDAYEIWNKEMNFPAERIVRLGKDDNFWEIGTGPCGPCSELYFDRGEKYGCGEPGCKPGCDCDRYIEFWNHVFTQFDKDENGVYNKLENPNIDTGMGLERLACIMQDVDSIFEIDTIKYILDGVLEISGSEYGKSAKDDVSIRIITDHIRASAFLISDGVLPSNEGRGYVLRRLIRRAARHGKLLGVKGGFLNSLVDRVIEINKDSYPELKEKEVYIKKILTLEEDRFQETIGQGMEILNSYLEDLKSKNETKLSGENAFKLYDTYGFPIDLTKEILEEQGFQVSEDEFKQEMEIQRNRARNARKSGEGDGWKEDVFSELDKDIKSEFIGYFNLNHEGKVLAMVSEDKIVEEISKGQEGVVIFDKTVFYPEGGGQVGDRGCIQMDGFEALVLDTKKGINNRIHHHVKVLSGSIKVGDMVSMDVEKEDRMASARNHSATHILHDALRSVLGDHVQQSGSYVTPQRLRFDFTHFEGITKDELKEIENIVNSNILSSHEVEVKNTSMDEAKKMGATALFGEKYGQSVRVVKMGESVELCGGTHVGNTSSIGLFKIVSETGVAAGVRRIEAITGIEVYKYINEKEALIQDACEALKTREDNLLKRIDGVNAELKSVNKELADLKKKMSMSSLDDILKKAEENNGINIIVEKLDGVDMNSLRELADTLRDKVESSVVILGCTNEDKVNFIVTASDEAVKRGIHCGKIIKEAAKVAGGGGGGRPNMAQAGGKNPAKIDEALETGRKVLLEQIKG